MTPEEREAFYDAEVAPVLLDLCKRCQDRGMGFVAMVDYSGRGNIGRTVTLPVGSPAVLRYAHALGSAGLDGGAVNIDGFMIAVMREAREKGHSSAVLFQLGVPTKPIVEPSS